jgi:hypothetical protein
MNDRLLLMLVFLVGCAGVLLAWLAAPSYATVAAAVGGSLVGAAVGIWEST